MTFAIILLILYFIPISIGIIIIRYILVRTKIIKPKSSFLKYSFSILSITYVILNLVNWFSMNHWVEFRIDQNHICKIQAEEIESFLDVPTYYNIEIFNNESELIDETEFTTGDCDCLIFLTNEQSPGELLIRSCYENERFNIHLKNPKLPSNTDLNNFKEFKILDGNFELK